MNKYNEKKQYYTDFTKAYRFSYLIKAIHTRKKNVTCIFQHTFYCRFNYSTNKCGDMDVNMNLLIIFMSL